MKIAVGLSGGVDSSVAALLLKQQGYDVMALFMQNWHDTAGTLHGDCSWEEDRLVAEMVAKKLDIPFHFVDLSDVYRKRVVDYMFAEYSAGRTPNPDVLCNSEIKFDAFLKTALEMGADYVATGHYCIKDSVTCADGSVKHRLIAGADPNKDQSYFLCQLTQDQLSRAMFPIGHLEKKQVRLLAKEAGLPSAERKDSQGICFVGKVDLPVFLQQKLKPVQGNVVEIFRPYYDSVYPRVYDGSPVTEELLEKISMPYTYSESDGKKIGIHNGAQYYTIGQRKGLNIGGHAEPVFIISTDIESNLIFVGEGHSHPGLYRSCLFIRKEEVHWIRPDLSMEQGEARRFQVRIRYRQPLQGAVLHMCGNGLYILFDEPQRGITPGQFAAWYSEEGELVSSGVIMR